MDDIWLASIGDCCMDRYPEHGEIFPGGTAFNVAVQSINEGAKASLFSAIGKDPGGEMIKKVCKDMDIDCTYLEETEEKTSTIDIQLNEHKHPIFSNWNLGALGTYRLSDTAKKILPTYHMARIVLFKPMKTVFDEFCALSLPNTMKIADFAGTSDYADEVAVIDQYVSSLDMVIKSIDEHDAITLEYFKKLSTAYSEKLFLALRGSWGSSLFYNGEQFDQPAEKVDVQDTNGAGDAFVGSFLINYHRTKDIQFSLFRGSLAAAQIISHRGAVTIKK